MINNLIYSQASVEWIKKYDGPDKLSDNAYISSLDKDGNLIITGMCEWVKTGPDYNTVKYNPQGELLWKARYTGPHKDDLPIAMTIDDKGNIYVTGRSDADNGASDYATVKYNSEGTQLWIQRYNGALNRDDIPQAIVVDKKGNVYVSGSAEGTGNYNTDYATVKYNSDGVQQWVAKYNDTGNNTDVVKSMVIDNSGDIIITGSGISSRKNNEIVTIKYNESGVEQWIKKYETSFTPGAFGYALAADDRGNIYIAGDITGDNKSDACLLKYNSKGDLQWVRTYDSPSHDVDYYTNIVLDNNGNIYTAGYSIGNGTGPDFMIMKFSSEGEEKWTARYNGPGNDNDVVTHLAADCSGNIYVTGMSDGAGTNADFATIKYNPEGVQQWVERYNGSTNDEDNSSSIAIDKFDNVYVTGNSITDKNYNTDYVTIKYH